ncbi:MAG: DUF2617 family protein [Planctomycetaceae bacterium]|nr:DUF2617 family protein [Planctomycetaceae bacterium]
MEKTAAHDDTPAVGPTKRNGMITTRPCVSELTLLHYAKLVHPEFFRIVASRTVERGNYSLTLHLTSTGHVAMFRTNATDGKPLMATEVATSAHLEMPGSPVSELRFQSKQHETFRISEILDVETTFECDTLDRKTFMAVQSELAKANELDGLFYHFGSNGRIALGGLSYLALETWQQRVRIRAYHTFPENCRVMMTDTVMKREK